MVISATEFKSNVGKYLTMADVADIVITRNGKSVAMLTNARAKKIEAVHALRGMISNSHESLEEIRNERLAKYDKDID